MLSQIAERCFRILRRVGPLSVAVLLSIAGCNGDGAHFFEAVQSHYVAPSCPKTGPLMFVSDPDQNIVAIFSGNTQCGQISNLAGPTGLAYNAAAGRLYVTNLPASTIGVYAAPYQFPVKTLSDPGQAPYGVAICKGYIAVSNNGTGTVSIYKGSSTSPAFTVADSNSVDELNVACDDSGDLFSTYLDSSKIGHVNEWIHGTGTPLELSVQPTEYPGGIKWLAGTLMVGDYTQVLVDFYQAPYTTVYKTIYMTQAIRMQSFAIAPGGSDLVMADPINQNAQRYHLNGGFVRAYPVAGGAADTAFNKAASSLHF